MNPIQVQLALNLELIGSSFDGLDTGRTPWATTSSVLGSECTGKMPCEAL